MLVTIGVFVALGVSSAQAYTQVDRNEQTRYANETMSLSYMAFLARKADFTASGCRIEGYENNGYAYPGCQKPSPYNAFNWTDDGCSGPGSPFGAVSLYYRNLFNKPCQLHDFGYRNFGKGLTLGRDEATRSWIDGRFLQEMQRLCDRSFSTNRLKRTTCRSQAYQVWSVVRLASDWTQPGDPLAPLDPPAPSPTPPPAPLPVYTVMNTSETLPDGVWFRNSPHTADTDRVTGHGVYGNEQVQLRCYAWGDAVGPYSNTLWYNSLNVTRTTIGGSPNTGFLNGHYVNDGMAANQVAPNVPPC